MNPTARPWDADVDVTPVLAARLIDAQFPELAPARVELLATGWDNAAFTVNAEWIFRLPRRKLGAECLENEIRWVPGLATSIPLPITAPARVGQPQDGYPYSFAGYRRIKGDPACMTAVSARVARSLGEALAALHRIPVPEDAPGDALKRSDLAKRFERSQEPTDRLAARGEPIAPARRRMESLLGTAAWSGRRSWLHGDLYARHVLLRDGALAGLIDWGDVHAGDPALDLSIAFSLFDGRDRDAFLDAYGGSDAATLDRARFRALHYGLILTDYGLETGDIEMLKAGRRALAAGLS